MVLLMVAGVARADIAPSVTASELAALKSRIAQLESQQSENWLNERRAEEVKSLIQDVLADADTRASLLQEGATAGHDGGHFWIGSSDGTFLLRISGIIQVRHTYNDRNGDRGTAAAADPTFDQGETGFSIPRAKVEFSGHISSPRVLYALRLAVDSNTNDVFADKIVISYCLQENLWISAGEDKAPFLREEQTKAEHLLTVDRSLINELFTAGTVQGVWVNWHASDQVHVAVAITDGIGSGGNNIPQDFNQDDTDFAISARADVRLDGSWEQMEDFTGWSGEAMAIFIGGAIHYETRETGDDIGAHTFDTLLWTVDGSLEMNGMNLYVAFVGADFEHEGSLADASYDGSPWGVVVQGGYHLIPDKLEGYIRYEHLDLDFNSGFAAAATQDDDTIDLLTFGANWYLNKHQTKVTVELGWALDTLPQGNINNLGVAGASGFLADSGTADDQIYIATQVTLTY
jgi:hypothetical protein